MKYNSIGVMLNRECNANCEICCFECVNGDKKIIDINAIKTFIKTAKNVNEIKSIGISGGEPFLAYNELIEVIKCAHECNKNISIITNGSWGQSYKSAKEIINV